MSDLGYILGVLGQIFMQCFDLLRIPVFGGYSFMTVFITFGVVEVFLDFILDVIEKRRSGNNSGSGGKT
jgi:hypothetical protein